MVYLKNWWLLGATLFAVASIVAAACVGADGDEIFAPEPTVAEDIPSGEEVHANAESEPESKPERAPAPPQAMGDPERGRALYSANSRAFCHGENGQGGSARRFPAPV